MSVSTHYTAMVPVLWSRTVPMLVAVSPPVPFQNSTIYFFKEIAKFFMFSFFGIFYFQKIPLLDF